MSTEGALGRLGRRSVVMFDLVGSTGLPAQTQVNFYHLMRVLIAQAASGSDLDFASWVLQDQGDGLLAILPSSASEATLVTRFVDELTRSLEDVNRTEPRRARLRLRLAIGHGDLVEADGGYVGAAPATVEAILDSGALRRYVQAENSALLATALTSNVYDEIISSGKTRLEPEDFFSVVVQTTKIETVAWIKGRRPLGFESARSETQGADAIGRRGSAGVNQTWNVPISNTGDGPISIGSVHLPATDDSW